MKSALALLLLVTLTLTGCAAPPDAPTAAVPERDVRPPGVKDPAPPNTAPVPPNCDPRASLAPDPAPGPTTARIVERGYLVAGVNQNAYQVGHRDATTGELVGFEIDLVRALAAAMFGDPGRVRYVAVAAADRVAALRDGQVDVVVRTMTMTCADRADVTFSTEYFTARQRLLVRLDSGVAAIEELAGSKVCAAAGSTSLDTIGTASPSAVPVSTQDVIDCLILLQQRQVDAVSTSDILLAALAAQDPNTTVVGPTLREQPFGVAVASTAPDLVRFVNAVLERYRADGSWTLSYNRWLTPFLGAAPPPPTARYAG